MAISDFRKGSESRNALIGESALVVFFAQETCVLCAEVPRSANLRDHLQLADIAMEGAGCYGSDR